MWTLKASMSHTRKPTGVSCTWNGSSMYDFVLLSKVDPIRYKHITTINITPVSSQKYAIELSRMPVREQRGRGGGVLLCDGPREGLGTWTQPGELLLH